MSCRVGEFIVIEESHSQHRRAKEESATIMVSIVEYKGITYGLRHGTQFLCNRMRC